MVLLLFQHTFLPISMWRPIICPGVRWFQSGISPQVAQAAFHLWGLPEVDLLPSSCTTQCQCYYTMESPLPPGDCGLNAFNHPWMFQVSYVFPSPTLVPLVLSKFLAEYFKGQLKLLILVVPCWMEVPWLPTVLNMLADIPWQCPIIKDLIMDVLVGHGLKGLLFLHLTLWLLRDVSYTDWVSLPQSVRHWWVQLEYLHQRSTSSVGRNGQVGVLKRVYQTMPYLTLNELIFYSFISGWHSLAYNWYILLCYFCFFRTSLSSQGF